MLTKKDFKVEIINKEEVLNFFQQFGLASCICYATPDKFAEKVGKSCLKTGHMSGSRGNYIKFKITHVPRALVDQAVRHDVGTYKNVQSQRYTDGSNMNVYFPKDILDDEELFVLWTDLIVNIQNVYTKTANKLVEKGYTNEQAREVARGISPMNIESSFVMGFTAEALINFMNKRLCTCSQEHIRYLATLMKQEVVKIRPEFNELLVPSCITKLYCPEDKKRSCGIRPTKQELELIIKNNTL